MDTVKGMILQVPGASQTVKHTLMRECLDFWGLFMEQLSVLLSQTDIIGLKVTLINTN